MTMQKAIKGGMKIGAAIRAMRKERGWTLDDLAERAHTSKSNLSNLEGDRQGYSPVLLASLADAFGYRVSELFAIAEKMSGEYASPGKVACPPPPFYNSPETDELLRLWQQFGAAEREALLILLRKMT